MDFSARVIRKCAVAGLPLPGLMRRRNRDTSNIFLTFDDGPNPELTPRLLDLLANHSARASFFVNGVQVERHPEIAARIAKEGHLLGNHGYSHRRLTGLSVAEGVEEVERCQKLLEPYGAPRLFRPPHGLLGPRLLWKLVRAGYRFAYWSMDSGDSWDVDGGALGKQLLEAVAPGDVILLHDDRSNGIAAVELLLAAAQERGYKFDALDASS